MSNTSGETKHKAMNILVTCIQDIQSLPRFNGQTQIIRALKRVSRMAVWSK